MRRWNGPLKKVTSFALAGALVLAGLPVQALAEAGEAPAEVEEVDEAVGDPESGKAEEGALTEEGSPLEDGGQTAPAEPGSEDAAEDVAPDDGLVAEGEADDPDAIQPSAAEGESDEDALAPQVASGT